MTSPLCPVCVEVHPERPRVVVPPEPTAAALWGEHEMVAGIWPLTEEQRAQRIREEWNVPDHEVSS